MKIGIKKKTYKNRNDCPMHNNPGFQILNLPFDAPTQIGTLVKAFVALIWTSQDK